MSNDVKESFFDKQMTRRQFLKVSGKSIAGLTVTATMLSLFGCSQQEIDDEQVATWALPQGLLVVNSAKCTGCERCENNCTLVNDGEISTYISRVKVSRNLHIHGKDGMYNGSFTYYPDTCRQCKDPACGNACPQKAIIANGQGTRVVDESKCVGCGACVEACPWHMPAVNPETNKSSKCIACGACAAGCPSGALAIISWDEVTAAAQAIV
ncbi:ferredoxin-like protein [Anaerocolumna sp.]|uniref:ferredoxin-like protein n=1 Tax=Anaerocolumna sp. TaxID=2041569 RepID=UPI0028B267BE|nr:ferredoxin-like protein [Anaerocolumna sp.]